MLTGSTGCLSLTAEAQAAAWGSLTILHLERGTLPSSSLFLSSFLLLLLPCSGLQIYTLTTRLFMELVVILSSTAFPNIAIVQGSLVWLFFLLLLILNIFYNRKVAGIKLGLLKAHFKIWLCVLFIYAHFMSVSELSHINILLSSWYINSPFLL